MLFAFRGQEPRTIQQAAILAATNPDRNDKSFRKIGMAVLLMR